MARAESQRRAVDALKEVILHPEMSTNTPPLVNTGGGVHFCCSSVARPIFSPSLVT